MDLRAQDQGWLHDDDLYGFLTTDPNDLVKPIHDKAMSVLLPTKEETDIWMTVPWERPGIWRGHCRMMR